MLNIMKHMKFLRKLLPAWHAREKEFRSWYINLVDTLTLNGEIPYDTYVNIFETPEEVRGYRKVRYPKMEEAKQKVASLLSRKKYANEPMDVPQELRILN